MVNKYPEGAIKTLEEIRALVGKTQKGEIVRVHSFVMGGSPKFASFTVLGWFIRDNQLLVKVDRDKHWGPYDQGAEGKLRLSWRNIPESSWAPDNGFLFTNYWHAYAYSLRFKSK